MAQEFTEIAENPIPSPLEENQPELPEPPTQPTKSGRKKIAFGAVVRCVLSILLAMVLIISLTGAALIAATRHAITPEYVYTYLEGLDVGQMPLILQRDGADTCVTAQEAIILAAKDMGLTLKPEETNYFLDGFKIGDILTVCVQATASWFFWNGQDPAFTADLLAGLLLSNAEESMVTLLNYFGEPFSLISGMFEKLLRRLEGEGLFAHMEAVKPFLTSFALVQAVVIGLFALLLLYLLNHTDRTGGFGWIGVSLFCTGGGIGVLAAGTPYLFGILFPVYGSYLTAFASPVRRLLAVCGVCGILTGLFVGCIALLCVWFSRRAQEAKGSLEE